MPVTAKTLDAVKQYHEIQGEIDRVDGLVSALKKSLKPEKGRGGFVYASDDDISDNLGRSLVKSIGPGLIKLLEAERVLLLAEQAKLEG